MLLHLGVRRLASLLGGGASVLCEGVFRDAVDSSERKVSIAFHIVGGLWPRMLRNLAFYARCTCKLLLTILRVKFCTFPPPTGVQSMNPFWSYGISWWPAVWACESHHSSILRNLLRDYASLISPNRSRLNLYDRWKKESGENVHCRRGMWFVAAISWSRDMPLTQLKLQHIFFFVLICALRHNWHLFLAPWLVHEVLLSYASTRLTTGLFKPCLKVNRAPI